MSKKKKHDPVFEEKAIVPVEISCSCVGHIMRPAGAGFEGKVVKQKYIEKLDMLLLYFENKYVCQNTVCKLVEKEE